MKKTAFILIIFIAIMFYSTAAHGAELKYPKPQVKEAPASWFDAGEGAAGGAGGAGATGAAGGAGLAGAAGAQDGPGAGSNTDSGLKLCCLKEILRYLYQKPGAIAFREQSEWSKDIVGEAVADGLIPEFMQNIYTRDITRGEYALLLINLYEYFSGELICVCANGDAGAGADAGAATVRSSARSDARGAANLAASVSNKARLEYQISISREEAAAVAVRMMESLGCELRGGWPVFADEADISASAKPSVGKMQALGVFQGNADKRFNPKGHMTVEQSVKIVMGVKNAVLKLREEKIPVTDPSVKGKAIPILMYHAVADVPNTGNANLFVRPSELEAQMKYLADNGYQTVTFEDLGNIGAFSKPVMLTFDDGYKDNYVKLFPLLKKYGQHATVFMITDAVYSAEFMSIDNLLEMQASGLVSIQSHTRTHAVLTELGKDKLREELTSSKAALEKMLGKPVNTLCYPIGKYNETVCAATAEIYDYGVIIGNSKFICGTSLTKMSRLYVPRGMSVSSFASLIK